MAEAQERGQRLLVGYEMARGLMELCACRPLYDAYGPSAVEPMVKRIRRLSEPELIDVVVRQAEDEGWARSETSQLRTSLDEARDFRNVFVHGIQMTRSSTHEEASSLLISGTGLKGFDPPRRYSMDQLRRLGLNLDDAHRILLKLAAKLGVLVEVPSSNAEPDYVLTRPHEWGTDGDPTYF